MIASLAHTYTDVDEALDAMDHLLRHHSLAVAESCGCYVCSVTAAEDDRQWPGWASPVLRLHVM